MTTNTFSGARCIFKVQDQKVAFASGCDGTEEILYEAVDVLDRIEVAEYVPVGYRVTFNCNVFRTIQKRSVITGVGTVGANTPEEGTLGSLKYDTIGIFPRSTGNPSNILTNGALNASITDRLTDTVLYKLEEVKAQTLNFSITARGIDGQNVSFNAIRMRSEDDGL